MDDTYLKKQDILSKRGITPSTKHHDYDYLYKCMITAMEEYYQTTIKDIAAKYPNDAKFGGEIRKLISK